MYLVITGTGTVRCGMIKTNTDDQIKDKNNLFFCYQFCETATERDEYQKTELTKAIWRSREALSSEKETVRHIFPKLQHITSQLKGGRDEEIERNQKS